MGKSNLCISMARNMAIDFGMPVALFSLEMASVQLITRLISSETGLSSEKLRTKLEKNMNGEQLSTKVKNLEKAPLFIDDTPSLSISIYEQKQDVYCLQSELSLSIICN
jgi:replicative DNA helicase